MARHFKTSSNAYSICELTGENDVYVSGETVSGMQPNDYCVACNEAEPEWIEVSDEEYFKLEQTIF